jgi:hypothetical protein
MPESARFDELGIPVLQGGEDVKARFYGSKKGFANFPLQTLDFVGGGEG